MLSFMNLLQMSVSGGVIIFMIVMLRALFMNRLPKKVFLVLWMIALFRLLIPLSVSSPFSIYTLAQKNESIKSIMNTMEEMPAEKIVPPSYVEKGENRGEKENINVFPEDVQESKTNHEITYTEGYSRAKPDRSDSKLEEKRDFPVWMAIYITGVIVFAGYFVSSYIKSRGKFGISIPVDQKTVQAWINRHPIKRKISIRQSEFTCTPLTYGIISPVILMPKMTDWKDKEQLEYILAHEFIHIKRFDAVTKIIMAGILCIHWFNPAVWCMYNLLNRDLEISCDEEVIRQFGEKTKASYARTLISMEEKKSGLVPLWNSFSKNTIGKSAMEERIIAIMKIKKTSVIAIFAGMVLVLVIAIAFATSAMAVSEKDYLKRLPFEDLSDDESDKLLALWFDGYESMTVADFQKKVWELTDTRQYMDLIEDFAKSEYMIEMEEGKEADALNEYMDYFHHVFEPLTAERWQVREFSGFAVTNLEPEEHAQVSWEYVISLKIIKPNELKVGEYRDARLLAVEDMRSFLQSRTEAELSDQVYLQKAARETVSQIEKERSSKKLELSIEYALFPLEENLEDAVNAQVNQQWDETLAPYLEFGLTYEYIPSKDNLGNGLRMYWEGYEVRGIFDEERGMWISEHIGDGLYSADAVELHVVYEKGKAVGLRPADKEEQRVWDTIRKDNRLRIEDNALSLRKEDLEEDFEAENREFPNGNREDYDSLDEFLSSKYQEMSVKEFNAAILDWCNEDYERMERIGMDSALGDYAVPLTEEEKDFAAFTLWFSRMENACMIQSEHTKKKEENPEYKGGRMDKQSENGLAWCTLDYRFTYHIEDKDKLKVGERDECLKGMIEGIEEFWEGTNLENLLLMEKEDIAGRLQFLANKYSNDLLTIQIDEDMIHYQCKDERGFIF